MRPVRSETGRALRIGDLYLQNLMTPAEAAAHLAVSPRTLEAWRIKGGGPRYVRLTAKAVRYALADLADWIAAKTVANTAQALVSDGQR